MNRALRSVTVPNPSCCKCMERFRRFPLSKSWYIIARAGGLETSPYATALCCITLLRRARGRQEAPERRVRTWLHIGTFVDCHGETAGP
jgi:hypothetical protein